MTKLSNIFNKSLKLFINERINSLKIFLNNSSKNRKNEIPNKTVKDLPGPKPSLPIIGTGWQYYRFIGKYDIRLLHEVLFEKFQKYGPIFREEYQRNKPIVYICDPKDIETLFRYQGKCPLRPSNDFVIHYRSKHKHKYSSAGIVNMNGIQWFKTRQLLAPPLLKMKNVRPYVPNLDIICNDLIEFIQNEFNFDENTNCYTIEDFGRISYSFVFESMCSWCLNSRLGSLDITNSSSLTADGPVLINATKNLFESYQKLFYSTKLWKYYKTKAYRQMESAENTIYKTLSKYVDSALVCDNSSKSMINELSKLNKFTPNEIKVTLMDFIIGGLFNVSNALNFVCYHLAKNPRIQHKLYEEINEVMNKSNDITVEKLSRMPYLKACIRESFRLTSIIPGIIRALPSDLILSGYSIPKGTLVFANFMTTCLSDQYFSDPKSFIPERWLGNSRHSIHSFSLLPFGFGNRMCIGKHFAQLHIQMAVLTIIKEYKLSIKRSDEIDLICDFLIVPNRPIKMTVEKRTC